MTEYLPLTLGTRVSSVRMADHHKPVMAGPMRQRVLEDDSYQCRFCGLVARKWMEIFHLDGNHANIARENLATACPLCHQCDHLDLAGIERGGRVIWLPEISQSELNMLCVALFVAVFRKGAYADTAKQMYAELEARANLLEQRAGIGAYDPNIWSAQLQALPAPVYAARAARLEGVRLLPTAARFMKPIRYWATEAFPNKYPEIWDKFHEIAAGALATEGAHGHQ